MNVVNYLRGAVFRLRIQAINTWGADQEKFNEKFNLIGKITWAWAIEERLK